MTPFADALGRFYAEIETALLANDAQANDFCRAHGLLGFGPAPVFDAEAPLPPESLRCTALHMAISSFGVARPTVNDLTERAAAFLAFLTGGASDAATAERAAAYLERCAAARDPMPDPRARTDGDA